MIYSFNVLSKLQVNKSQEMSVYFFEPKLTKVEQF